SSQLEWGAATAPDDEKNTDDNESVDSLEACLRETQQQSPFDDRETFDKMEQALRDAQRVLNIDENVGGNSDDADLMDLRSNPNHPVTYYTSDDIMKRKEDKDIADNLTFTKSKATEEGTEDDTFDVTTLGESEGFFSDNDPIKTAISVGRKQITQSRDEVSRALYDANGTVNSSMQYTSQTPRSDNDDDYVTNMVEDTKRRRRKNEHKPSYWDTYDSETVGSATIYQDDELDNSTLTGTYYTFEDATLEDDRDERRRDSSREENEEEIMDDLDLLCSGELCMGIDEEEDELPRQITKKEWKQKREKDRRNSSKQHGGEEVTDTREDASTFLSGYTREDTLEGATGGGTNSLLSGDSYTAENGISAPKETTLSEPEFLVDGNEGENAFDFINNVCSSSWFRCGGYGAKKEDGIKNEGNEAKELDVAAPVSVKERLRSTAMEAAKGSTEQDTKERDKLKQSKSDMSSNRIIRSPSQDELRAIYESTSTVENTKPSLISKAKSFNRTVSSFRRQKSSKLASPSAEPNWSNEIHAFTVSVTSADPKQGASTEMINRDVDSIEITSQCKRDALNLNNEKSKNPSSARSRSRLFTFKSKKDSKSIAASSVGNKQPSTGSKLPPASPARTAATGTSDSSIESRSSDDDTSLSDAELAITRTGSRILISI
ncbi:hypothetical protein ACHAWC_001845, partial [Mediolabrus comicus]